MKYILSLILIFMLGCSNKPELPEHKIIYKVEKPYRLVYHIELDNITDSNILKLNDFYYYSNSGSKPEITLYYFKSNTYSDYKRYLKDTNLVNYAFDLILYSFSFDRENKEKERVVKKFISRDSNIVLKKYP